MRKFEEEGKKIRNKIRERENEFLREEKERGSGITWQEKEDEYLREEHEEERRARMT